MAKINEALEFLNDLIHSNVDDVIKMSKDALCNIQNCLQDAQEKIEFLQLESQLQQEELQQKSHHSEPVSVQKIVKDSHQKKEDKVADDQHSVPCSSTCTSTCRCSSSTCTSQAHHQTLGRACPQQAQN